MTTDSLHINPSRAMIKLAATPAIMQVAASHLPVIDLRSSMPSMSMLLPRDTISASRPQPKAAAVNSPTVTRQAMLPHGSSTVHSQV